MAIDYRDLISRTGPEEHFAYSDTELLLYNLSVGMGSDPEDQRERQFVFEQPALLAVPTFAAVLNGGARSGLFDRIDIDWTQVLHGGQRLQVHRPFPPSADLISRASIAEVVDKGSKGAVIAVRRETFLASGEPLCSTENIVFARANGGFGGPAESRHAPHIIPDRAPDFLHVTPTRPDQALLYRLNGDRNPLHADPAFAKAAGFPAPILHGLCSYGMACRAVLATVCRYDPARMKSFDVRLTAPVYPGEVIHTDIWLDGPVVSFRCRVEARGIILLNNGRCMIAA